MVRSHHADQPRAIIVDTKISLLKTTNGFLPLITKPTRITSSSATITDHLHTSNWNKNTTTEIIKTDVTDHFRTFHSVKTRPVISNPKTR